MNENIEDFKICAEMYNMIYDYQPNTLKEKNNMKNESDFLKIIDELKTDKSSSKGKRKVSISLLTLGLRIIKSAMKYEKLKIDRHKLGDIDFKIDICESEDLLLLFFGSNDVKEQNKKFKVLKTQLSELKKKKAE